MLSEAQIRVLAPRHQAQLRRLREWTGTQLAKAWDALPAYDRAQIAGYIETVTPIVDAAREAAVAKANGFYSVLTGVPAPGIGIGDIGLVGDLEGPFLAHWHALAEGRDFTEAVQAGRNAAEAEGQYMVQSASRRTGDVFVEATGTRVVGWVRVLDGKACRWCAKVAGQRYRTAESADFGHTSCGCDAWPVFADSNPGHAINKPLREQILAPTS